MKKDKKLKIKWTWKLITLLSVSFLFVFSAISVIPGCAIESLMTINSVKKVVNNHIPKGKYVIDHTSKIFEDVGVNILKNTFKFDGELACNWYDSNDISKLKQIDQYADDWYNKYWKEKLEIGNDKVDDREDVDLNQFSMNVIDFDISLSKKFFSKGLTNPGISWIFTNFSDIFSSETSKQYERYERIADQNEYEKWVSTTTPNIIGNAKVYSSPGNYVVNQKTYFLNYQLESIKAAINPLETPFKDKTLKASDITLVSPTELYRPKLTNTLNYLRFSIILLIISTISTIGFGGYLVYDKIKGKK